VIRYAVRSLLATPVVTGVAVLSLALGIGANTALFTLVNTLLLKPLPVRDPERLALLEQGEDIGSSWTNPIWEAVREHESVVDGAFAWSSTRFNLSKGGETEFVDGVQQPASPLREQQADQRAEAGQQEALGQRSMPARRRREAPSARRTASSCRRTVARARSRLPMLAHAICSTSATTTIKVRSGRW
jgi:hypothetical protein